jgi:hypothetical protein
VRICSSATLRRPGEPSSFARYEASQFLSSSNLEAIRHSITQHGKLGLKVPASVDLPLSHECKRVLVYAVEESERMNHEHIGTPDLLLGLLREEKSFAAQLLHEQGLRLESAREQVDRSDPPLAQCLRQWVAEREARGGIWTVEQKSVVRRRTDFAIYAGPPKKNETNQDMAPAEKLAPIQKRILFIIERLERAITNHEFEKARFYSDEERKERENLRLLREQFNLEEPPPLVPSCASRSFVMNVSPMFKNGARITLTRALPRSGFWTPIPSAPTPSPRPKASASSKAESSSSQTRHWK